MISFLEKGPIASNVYDRNLVEDEEPLAKDILTENGAYFEDTTDRHFNGTILGYVTPWNNHGYDVAKIWGQKFDIVSPVWLQIVRLGEQKYELRGTHDIDRGWVAEIKAGGVKKVFPRILFDKFSDTDFSRMLTLKQERGIVNQLILKACKEYGFEGIVLEVWSTLAARVDDNHLINLVTEIADSLRYQNYGLVLVIPPSRKETVELFTPEHFERLQSHVLGFSLMTYDFSSFQRPGPNAPIYWVKNAVQYICPDKSPEKRAKILLGLNFYGNDFTPEGGRAIVREIFFSEIWDFKNFNFFRLLANIWTF